MAAADDTSELVTGLAIPVIVANAGSRIIARAVGGARWRTFDGNAPGKRVPGIALGDLQHHTTVRRGRQKNNRTVLLEVSRITLAFALLVVTDSSSRTFIGTIDKTAIFAMEPDRTVAHSMDAFSRSDVPVAMVWARFLTTKVERKIFNILGELCNVQIWGRFIAGFAFYQFQPNIVASMT